MRLIIAGSRTIPLSAYASICFAITKPKKVTEVVSGCARGADRLGERWAAEHKVPVQRFPAHWNRYGRVAGRMRNREMAKYADCLLAIWDGISTGTGNMIYEMRALGKPVKVVEWRS